MTTKEDYEKLGRTHAGEAVYRNRRDGCISTEKDHSYLVLSTHREIEEAGMAVIEDSFRNTEIWIPTGERVDRRKVFRYSKDGRLAIRTGKNRMKVIQTPTGNAMTTILDSYEIDSSTDQERISDMFLARRKGKVSCLKTTSTHSPPTS